jgi:hypothetical protein
MTDMLDFFDLFWDDKLDSPSSNVDNKDITNGDLTYAANSYCGVLLGGVLGLPELREAKAIYLASPKNRKRRKGLQYQYSSNTKSHV